MGTTLVEGKRMDAFLGVGVVLLLVAWTVVLMVTNTDIPWPLRVAPLAGLLLMLGASATDSPTVVVVVGAVILGIGFMTDFVYENFLGGGSKSKGTHGLGREELRPRPDGPRRRDRSRSRGKHRLGR
jgi:hypothetical protein